MSKAFDFTPKAIPAVRTRFRRIMTPIPAPDSLEILDTMRRHEPTYAGPAAHPVGPRGRGRHGNLPGGGAGFAPAPYIQAIAAWCQYGPADLASTHGGNSVCAAAALAGLKKILDEGLVANAQVARGILHEGLAALGEAITEAVAEHGCA